MMPENRIHLQQKRFYKSLAFALHNTGFIPYGKVRGGKASRRNQGRSVMHYLERGVRAIYLSLAIPSVVALMVATALVDDTLGLTCRHR
jgi:hypothetical protein